MAIACAATTLSANAADYLLQPTNGDTNTQIKAYLITATNTDNNGNTTYTHNTTATTYSDIGLNDTLKLNGTVKGYFNSQNGFSTNANIDLGAHTLEIANGWSGSDSSLRTQTFNGDITGTSESNIKYTGTPTYQHYIFNGDLTSFNGNLNIGGTDNKLTFNRTATTEIPNTLNAGTITAAGTLNFDTGYTVNSNISAGTLNINAASTFGSSSRITVTNELNINAATTFNYGISASTSTNWTSAVPSINIAANTTFKEIVLAKELNITSGETNFEKTTTLSALNVASGATANFKGSTTLKIIGGDISNLGTINLGNQAKLTLSDSAQDLFGEYNVGTFQYGDRVLSNVLNFVGSRQSVTYENGVIKVTNTGAQPLKWAYTNTSAANLAGTNNYSIDGESGYTTFQGGDDIVLVSSADKAGIRKDVQVSASMSAGTVTVKDAYSINVTASKTFSGDFITEGAGASITKTGSGVISLNKDSNVSTLTVSDGTAQVQSGASVSSATVSNGILLLGDGDHSNVSDITIATNSNAGYGIAVANGTTATMKNGLTLQKSASATDGNHAVFKAIEGSDTWEASGIKIYRNNGTTGAIVKYDGSTESGILRNLELDVTGKLIIQTSTFENSHVIVAGEAILYANTGNTVTLDALTVKAGGSVAAWGNGGTFTYTGSINLELNALTDAGSTQEGETLPAFSTSALLGTMNSGSSLTLNLDAVEALSSFQKGDSFLLTLEGLTLASGVTPTTETFSATGWDVYYDADTQTTGNTTLKLTKAVPEPTTATLSLLALAGLAARRRRK